MNSCAYCGKTVDSQSFICEACSNPNNETKETATEKKKTPLAQKNLETTSQEVLTTEKPSLIKQPKDNSNEISSVLNVIEKNKKPSQNSADFIFAQPILETSELQTEVSITDDQPNTGQNIHDLFIPSNTKESPVLDSTAWAEQPINKDLSSKVVIFNLVLIILPLVAMVILTLLIRMETTLKVGLIITISTIFSVTTVAHFIELRWLKYASFIYKNTEPVDAYIYLKSNNPVLIKIYDEDRMYPEFSEITSISPKTGNVELLGIYPKKPDKLVPVQIKTGSYGPLNAMILEANGHRVWCKFNKKED